jgi:hypothetical protein
MFKGTSKIDVFTFLSWFIGMRIHAVRECLEVKTWQGESYVKVPPKISRVNKS